MAHFLPEAGVAQRGRVLLLARDIANPSAADRFFPLWRHKDWFLGGSWASGIVKREWGPDPHGRNQVHETRTTPPTRTAGIRCCRGRPEQRGGSGGRALPRRLQRRGIIPAQLLSSSYLGDLLVKTKRGFTRDPTFTPSSRCDAHRSL